MYKKVLIGILLATVLSGCAAQEDVNNHIALSNVARFQAFTEGMNSATTEGARIALSMAFAANMGTQDFFRERDGVDYITALTPYANYILPWAFGGYMPGGSGGVYVKATDDASISMDMSNTNDSFNTPTATSYENSYNTHEQYNTADSNNVYPGVME